MSTEPAPLLAWTDEHITVAITATPDGPTEAQLRAMLPAGYEQILPPITLFSEAFVDGVLERTFLVSLEHPADPALRLPNPMRRKETS